MSAREPSSMDSKTPMNIRQAARWAQRKDALYRVGYDGQPDYLCAVYDTRTHLVCLIGGYDKCQQYMKDAGCAYRACSGRPQADRTGRYLCMETLEGVCQELEESEGEARCIPERADMVEWA